MIFVDFFLNNMENKTEFDLDLERNSPMNRLKTNKGYALYLFDKVKGYELIAILPERRKKRERITQESIMKWAEMLLGPNAEGTNIVFKRVTIGESTDQFYQVGPLSKPGQK